MGHGIGIRGVGYIPISRMGGSPGGLYPWDFDPLLVSMTPGMAKRATSVFAAAPIVQGKRDGTGTGDYIDSSIGSLVVPSVFYSNFDSNQLSIVFRITPEWNGNDGVRHTIARDHLFGAWAIFKSDDSRLYVEGLLGIMSVDASAWVAGTAYNICIRRDIKNPIDGTNYTCISINDVHTFGGSTSSPVAGNLIHIGTHSASTLYPLNAIVEGLTIYRRVLYDGTYGVNVGNGDEVNLIAAGVDPTTITGSWDVVFCLPTNATPGALVTGAGEAWSHPHSSNLLTRGFLNDRYYGGSQWGVKFNDIASSYMECGSDVGLDNLQNAAFTFDGWFLSPGIGVSGFNYYISKRVGATLVGWAFWCDVTGAITGTIYGAIAAFSITSVLSSSFDSKWHHIAMTYNNAGDKKIYIYVDGIFVTQTQTAGDTPNDEAAALLIIGSRETHDRGFNGIIGWCRISNNVRYATTGFLPARTPPAVDGNTLAQWNMTEGTGVTVDNAEGTATRDGTINAGTWEPQWYDEGTPVRLRSVVGSSTYRAVLTSAAEISKLQDAAFTVDGWVRIDKSATLRYLCYKGLIGTNGWNFNVTTGGLLSGVIECVTTDATSASTARVDDGYWHYVKMTFDDAGDRKVDLFVDNVEVTYSVETAGNGAIVDDSGVDGAIGHATTGLLGAHGWLRWSNVVRGAGMIPRSNPPDPADANTIGQWNADEGAGAVLTDLSGEGNNGAMAGTYSWQNSPAMESDSPGARNYAWGYVFGNDAADEGFKQTWVGLTVGANYKVYTLAYSEEGVGIPEMIVYDETNGAVIAIATGTVTSTEKAPDRLVIAFKLPTVALGAGADCVSVSVKIVNTASTGVVGYQKVEWLPNSIDDPGYELNVAVTDVGTPTTSDRSNVQAHTGTYSHRIITDAIGEGFKHSPATTSGKYYRATAWIYSATDAVKMGNGATLQSGATTGLNSVAGASWKRVSFVFRAIAASTDISFISTAAVQTFYIDDFSVRLVDDVSLTVTPASAANSVESGGIRVDGWDLSPQPIPAGRLFASQGDVRIRYLPRHNGADALKFGSATPYIVDFYGDVNNYFYVYWSAANTMTLAFKSAGGALQTGNWATAGAILAGGNYLLEIKYMGNTMYLYVDNVLRITIASPIAFTTIPVFCYPATANIVVAGQHEDAVFLNP